MRLRAFQGNPRSLILAPTERLHTTNLVINSNPYPISLHRFGDIAGFFMLKATYDIPHPHSGPNFGMFPIGH